jgi:phosphonate transport system substrate-binding protein
MPEHPCTRRAALGILSASALAAAWPARAQGGAGHATYSVSVVPQFPAADLHRDWSPLLDRLSRDLGVTLTLKLSANIPNFEAELLAGHADFTFMNPYHQVMAMRARRYQPLVRDSRPLTGILVVRKDSAITTVHDLDGKELAFPAPNSFGASLWMRALLTEREHIAYTPSYVQTHSNVYRQVLRGKALAGGGVNNTLLQESEAVRNELRVLMETPGVAPHPLAAHPRVPHKLAQALADAFLRLSGDPAGQVLLKEVFIANPVRADYARDYRPLEQYKLEKYVVVDHPG